MGPEIAVPLSLQRHAFHQALPFAALASLDFQPLERHFKTAFLTERVGILFPQISASNNGYS